jgi:LmbE family N-acetylglucosaminyl deacetylase
MRPRVPDSADAGTREAPAAQGVEHWRRLPFLRFAPCHFNRSFLARRVIVVVAHPNDETIACGALLSRTSAVPVVLVTAGAPLEAADAMKLGAFNAQTHAETRRAEMRQALQIAGIRDDRLIALGFRDREVAQEVVPLAHKLAEIFLLHNSSTVLTHAYEGGHPDHDATALAVHLAGELLAGKNHPVTVFEMPFYRLGEDGPLHQSFTAGDGDGIEIALNPEEQALKERMIQCFATRKSILARYKLDAERFRTSALTRFSQLPNEGRLYYEARDLGMTGARWLSLAEEAIAAVRPPPI